MKRTPFIILLVVLLVIALFFVGVLFSSQLSQFDARLYATMTAVR